MCDSFEDTWGALAWGALADIWDSFAYGCCPHRCCFERRDRCCFERRDTSSALRDTSSAKTWHIKCKDTDAVLKDVTHQVQRRDTSSATRRDTSSALPPGEHAWTACDKNSYVQQVSFTCVTWSIYWHVRRGPWIRMHTYGYRLGASCATCDMKDI